MTSALEEIKTIDLEEWLTLATAPAPTKLKQGQSPDMQNVWIDEKPGSVITAPGFLKVGAIPSGNPVTFCIDYFRTSAGTQTFVVSDNSTVWTTVDFQNFTSIITGLSSAFQLRGAVVRDILWLTNGSDAVRTFDGTTVVVMDGSTTAQVVVQDITYKAAGINYSPPAITIAYVGGGVAGSEMVTIANTTQITVKIQSGVSTATQVLTAINGSASALLLVTGTITGVGGNAQVTASAVPLAGGTPNVPKARYIAYHDERVWLYHVSADRSAVYFSRLSDLAANVIDPTDVSAWDTIDNFLQVSEGDADFGTGMILYRGYLHFFKQYSIWRLVGYDEYTYSRVKTRASTGTRFNESVQILDSLVHLIGVDGIYVFDGEESVRISDIIDPATASQTAFGFNQLQQPNTNNQFWEVTATADWNAGTVPRNIAVDNELDLLASDKTQADFSAGAVMTHVDANTNPGSLQLALITSGGSSNNLSLNKSALLNSSNNVGQIGNAALITDGDLVNDAGFENTSDNTIMVWHADLGAAYAVGQAIVKGLYIESLTQGNGLSVSASKIQYSTDNVNWSDAGTITLNATSTGAGIFNPGTQVIIPAANYTVNFNTITARYWRLLVQGNKGAYVITELQIFQAGFQATGTFTSQTLDLGAAPASFGNLNATFALNGGTLTWYTQSSTDGTTWDAAVAVTPGSAIGSTLKRYLRWRADFTNGNGGASSPIISAVYLPALYLSAIHNTGGSIFAWGPFEADRTLPLQCNFYYRSATTSAGVSAASWNLIVPGGVLTAAVANQYVQFKVEILNGDSTHLPTINSVTVNWVVGSAGQPQTLQNVASAYWRNRYWLSAAGPGAIANNTVLVRGKKTFGSPWMLKDWNLLSYTRYFDSLYAGSSVDGSIYQLDTGYSKNGAAIDSHFETMDFTFGGFTAVLEEILVEAQRSGPYKLTIGYSVDGGNTFTNFTMDLTPSTYDTSYMKRFHVVTNNKTTRFRLRFSTNGIDTPFEVHRCIVFYRLEVERGSLQGDYN
jgi:hypothetical protein